EKSGGLRRARLPKVGDGGDSWACPFQMKRPLPVLSQKGSDLNQDFRQFVPQPACRKVSQARQRSATKAERLIQEPADLFQQLRVAVEQERTVAKAARTLRVVVGASEFTQKNTLPIGALCFREVAAEIHQGPIERKVNKPWPMSNETELQSFLF